MLLNDDIDLLGLEISFRDVSDEFELFPILEIFLRMMEPDVETVVLKEVVRFEAYRLARDEGGQRLRQVALRFALVGNSETIELSGFESPKMRAN